MQETAVKKITKLGELGGNTAEIIEEERNPHSDSAHHAQSLMEKAGEIYRPFNHKYLGSATIHFYSDESNLTNPQHAVICQTHIKKVSEHHADFGWKQLKSAFMKTFGRAEPKIRKS